ncbi:hypothetical protein [Thalassotalea sp. ND16A]|uniref:hypothetical protein n=1 Tax=Thalassotalea sp. ND16A TaxID=1535422 RepID=UPI00051DF520|nr:hypothetical protein [Thalassotalea sp. ND16A]KGJ90490.1 hypothetical protein ND16A_1886 [Thalassotalea sp. ND16A]
MPSSISNSKSRNDKNRYNHCYYTEDFNRDIPKHHWLKLILLTLSVFAILLTGWEGYWRSQGVQADYINSNSLWAIERRKVSKESVIFTGSSRMLFNLQTDIWHQQTGIKPIQLALEGTTPLSVLEDLADDDNFQGTVFVGVAPGLFFSGFEYRAKALKTYRQEAPSQWLGQQLAMLIEPHLSFLAPDFALFTIMKRQPWPEREGISNNLDVRKLMVMAEDRNTQMWDKVVKDEEYRKLAIKIWMQGFQPIAELPAEKQEKALENRNKQIERAVTVNKKMQAKGATLIFVRMPSQGFYTMEEGMYNPKADTWDVLLRKTGAPGIHFQDYPDLSKYTLPENSHLAAQDARSFTKDFVRIYQNLISKTEFSTMSAP